MPRWDANLNKIFVDYNNNSFKINRDMLTGSEKESPLFAISDILARDPGPNDNLQSVARTIIQYILNAYDNDDSLHGIFNALDFFKKRASPFLVAHDFCVKILHCCANGIIHLNISPIYRYPPDYPEYYQNAKGKKLDEDAIIGLLETPHDHQEQSYINKKFSLGIDAGIAFHDDTNSHNHKLTLEIKLTHEGMICNLTCENQTTCKIFSWSSLGVKTASCNDLFDQNSQEIWAA
ncbi:MAG: hypothetical protein K0U23_00090 [Gammaproteobacteria bacterium]|nr:hypothetical protein [Gammaproteobacteria bacterium]